MLIGISACSVDKEPVDYVNPYIGNVSHLLVPTFATVQLPNSMLRVYPSRADYTSEYLDGLPIIVTNHRERSAFKFYVASGDACPGPVSYDNEHLTPYSFDVNLADGAIDVHYALSHQSAIYRLEAAGPLTLVLASQGGPVEVDGNVVKATQTVQDQTCGAVISDFLGPLYGAVGNVQLLPFRYKGCPVCEEYFRCSGD